MENKQTLHFIFKGAGDKRRCKTAQELSDADLSRHHRITTLKSRIFGQTAVIPAVMILPNVSPIMQAVVTLGIGVSLAESAVNVAMTRDIRKEMRARHFSSPILGQK